MELRNGNDLKTKQIKEANKNMLLNKATTQIHHDNIKVKKKEKHHRTIFKQKIYILDGFVFESSFLKFYMFLRSSKVFE